MMISTNVHLFFVFGWKIKLNLGAAQYATVWQQLLMEAKHNASFFMLFIYLLTQHFD